VKKPPSVLIYLGLSIPILTLVSSLTAVKAVGDDYCFASTYKDLGFLGSFDFWFFDWVPTFSFFPIHLALLLDQGGTGSFAVHSIIHFAMNSLILYLLVSLISGLSIKKKIMYTLVSWNAIIIILGVTSPVVSKIWYATHWGLTISHFTTAILGLLTFAVSVKDKNWKFVIALSLWLSQLSAPEVISWIVTIFLFVVYSRKSLNWKIRQKLLASALIQSLFALGTILYTKLVITERSNSFSGSLEDGTIFTFLKSFTRLLFHQLIDTNNFLNLLVCFMISLLIFTFFGVKIQYMVKKDILPIFVFSTLSSFFVLPAADAYAYGAPWHNLQIIILSSILKTIFFYLMVCNLALKFNLSSIRTFRNLIAVSLSTFSLSLTLALLVPNLERLTSWNNRWDAKSNGLISLIPETIQGQPLQGDLESEWINDCYEKWRT
jgi:hypothetical protein